MAKDENAKPRPGGADTARDGTQATVDAMVVIYRLSTVLGITLEDATTVYMKVSARLSEPKVN